MTSSQATKVPDRDFAWLVSRFERASRKAAGSWQCNPPTEAEREAALEAARSALLARFEEMRGYAKALTVAFTGYVGGGSELFGREIGEMYTADIEFCIRRLRERDDARNERLLNATRVMKAAEAARHALDQAPEPRG